MEREQWMIELAQRFVKKAALSQKDADYLADSLADDMFPEHTPEEAFDEEVSCWGE
jgi:hypothetical protein